MYWTCRKYVNPTEVDRNLQADSVISAFLSVVATGAK